MAYRYNDIEARRLRSETLGRIMGAVRKKCMQWFARCANHQLHAPAAVVERSAAPIY